MLIGLRVANSLLFILLLLKRIELSKEKLIMDIDNRNWTVIPPDLSQEKLPASFRFYDFVINHIQDHFPQERKDQFGLVQNVSQKIHLRKSNENWVGKLLYKNKVIE